MKGTSVIQRPGGFAISDILELDRTHPAATTGLDHHQTGAAGSLDPVLYPPHHHQLPELNGGAPTTIIPPFPTAPVTASNHRHWTSGISPNSINDHGKHPFCFANQDLCTVEMAEIKTEISLNLNWNNVDSIVIS